MFFPRAWRAALLASQAVLAAFSQTPGSLLPRRLTLEAAEKLLVDSGTTDGVVAREGSNVSLACKASGHPEPNITWKREDGLEFIYNGHPGIINISLSLSALAQHLHASASLDVITRNVNILSAAAAYIKSCSTLPGFWF